MQITFLGTGTSQGVPVIACDCAVCRSSDSRDQRLRSSVVIEIRDKKFVVDCGPDFRQQMLREKISSIDAIFITHAHKDHISGLDDVRSFNYFLQKPTDVYTSGVVRRVIEQEFSYAFEKNPYPGVPEINLKLFGNKKFFIQDIEIIPIKAIHYEPDQFVYGFRINDFTYLTDVLKIPEEEKKKIFGTKILVLNALRKVKHYSHLNLDQAAALIKEIGPEKGFITHISHQMGTHRDVEMELPIGIQLAYDGLKIQL